MNSCLNKCLRKYSKHINKKTVIITSVVSASLCALGIATAVAQHILANNKAIPNDKNDDLVQNDLEALKSKRNTHKHSKNSIKHLKSQIKYLKTRCNDSVEVNKTLLRSLVKKDNLLNHLLVKKN